jgi:hypothetical protein
MSQHILIFPILSIRIHPFLQNTGGFFIAIFQKVRSFGALDKLLSKKGDFSIPLDDNEHEPEPVVMQESEQAEAEEFICAADADDPEAVEDNLYVFTVWHNSTFIGIELFLLLTKV